jgi:hypothetical protein
MSQPIRRRSLRSVRTAGGLLAAATLALGVLSACGSDEPADGASGTATGSSASGSADETSSSDGEDSGSGTAEAIAVTSVDFSFELDEDSFPAGTYEITLTNGGNATHDLVVERDGEDVAQSEQRINKARGILGRKKPGNDNRQSNSTGDC